MMLLKDQSSQYLDFLDRWFAHLPAMTFTDLMRDSKTTAVFCVDMINGFCTVGPLASPRVQGIVQPIASLFRTAYAAGVRHFILPQDTHDPQAVEFDHYPPHCVSGDWQSQTVPELLDLPFAGDFTVIVKNSISSSENTSMDTWLDAHPELHTFIVTGDCSDLCTYQLAMHLRLRANSRQMRDVRVIVPANCVQTYDTPMAAAIKYGIPPHDGDLLHAVFLHNMSINGVEVVGSVI
ncbi:MAG TPA: isochorismatase family cysteine hydrolase [Anaerolineae bacterium]|jgi:nicotinamidase-related amidase